MDTLIVRILTDKCDGVGELDDNLPEAIHLSVPNCKVDWNRYRTYSDMVITRTTGKGAIRKAEWMEEVSRSVARWLINRYEETVVKRIIRLKPFAFGPEHAEPVLKYCLQLLSAETQGNNNSHHGKNRRLELLVQDLKAYWKEQRLLNAEGFLLFRARKYVAELRGIVEYARDEYLMDQQYKEFISLLQYFVYVQESKIPEAHLLHKGGHEFVLLNENMMPIDTAQLDTSFKVEFLDKDYNLEDMIVSTLITIAPKRIYVHTREQELPVIKTIMQIFEERAQLCTLP